MLLEVEREGWKKIKITHLFLIWTENRWITLIRCSNNPRSEGLDASVVSPWLHLQVWQPAGNNLQQSYATTNTNQTPPASPVATNVQSPCRLTGVTSASQEQQLCEVTPCVPTSNWVRVCLLVGRPQQIAVSQPADGTTGRRVTVTVN